MTKHIKNTAKLSRLILLVCLLLVVIVGSFIFQKNHYANSSTTNYSFKKFTSDEGHFEISLPQNTTMTTERDNSTYAESNKFNVNFQFDDKNSLEIQFASPTISKGGACVDEQGNPAFQDVTILGQKVQECDTKNSIDFGYLKHPTKPIEYWIVSYPKDQKYHDIINQAVRSSFKFTW